MSWTAWNRRSHRWFAVIFTLVVAALFLANGIGREPAAWVYLLPLIPLALLFLSGLTLFVAPYHLGWSRLTSS